MGDFIRGTLWVIAIVAFAGGIAYIGDRVGHQVGRKRLSLFGVRPRYTSTIVAIGTGMLIALVVVIGAILASNSVKTAFFHLSAVNQRVLQLQAQADELERHVRNEQVVVNVGDLMNLQRWIVLPSDISGEERYRRLRAYYDDTAKFVNSYYVPLGLRRFVPPGNADAMLRNNANDLRLLALLQQGPVLVIATADENLFKNDPIHFQLSYYPDRLIYRAAFPITSVDIPANSNISLRFVLSQLQQHISQIAWQAGMPPQFAQNVYIQLSNAEGDAIQARLRSGSGQYALTATPTQNVFPHDGVIPITVTLTKR